MAKPEQTFNVNAVSRISEGTFIKGEITSPSDIRIDGSFEGKLISKGKVVVGEGATIVGDVICANMDMYGSIKGNIFVRDILTLKAGCEVDGNIAIRRLEVELDSQFNGNCKMITEDDFAALCGETPEAAVETAE
ncbi:MAG: polymer-forming cytoskeletal protein [Bacteroidales bacterium]|nr:polymer-forming cytoskeletal protein [Bacteroidales bacterium]